MNAQNEILARLMEVIHDRKSQPSQRSYTNSLFAGGVEKIGAKILEEAAEVVEAAGDRGAGDRQHLIHEAADLIYHLFVLLGFLDVSLEQVTSELDRRFGTSGLDEKEARSK